MTQVQDKKNQFVRVQLFKHKKVPTMGHSYFLDFLMLFTR